ncbi:MAG: hypothetical protein QF464_03105, partial [Myxococcota bacterium]|nr:hypothetical protein [Myxococcota bacterium]
MRDTISMTHRALGWCVLAVLAAGCANDDSISGNATEDVATGFATSDAGPTGDPNRDILGPDTPGVGGEDVAPLSCKTDDECVSVVTPGPCEVAACETTSGACVVTPRADGTTCDDGNPCVDTGACAQGTCIGQAVDCDDDDACTDDSCDPGSGCVYAYNEGDCDDGNACTTGDVCILGNCAAPEMLDCDDDDPCTADSCDVGFGCQHAPTNALCDDGDPCTTGDACVAGTCT